jgi:hypothetical protein
MIGSSNGPIIAFVNIKAVRKIGKTRMGTTKPTRYLHFQQLGLRFLPLHFSSGAPTTKKGHAMRIEARAVGEGVIVQRTTECTSISLLLVRSREEH